MGFENIDELVAIVIKNNENIGNKKVLEKFLREIKEGIKIKIEATIYETTGIVKNKFSPSLKDPRYVCIELENGNPYHVPYSHIKNFEIL